MKVLKFWCDYNPYIKESDITVKKVRNTCKTPTISLSSCSVKLTCFLMHNPRNDIGMFWSTFWSFLDAELSAKDTIQKWLCSAVINNQYSLRPYKRAQQKHKEIATNCIACVHTLLDIHIYIFWHQHLFNHIKKRTQSC